MAFKSVDLNIDTMKRNNIPIEGVNQEDNVKLNIVVTENGKAKDLSNQTIKAYVRRVDGTLVEQADQITITEATQGKITVNLKNSAFNTEGFALFQLDISDSNGRITSSYATFKVGKGLVSSKTIENTNEIGALEKVEEYIEKANLEFPKYEGKINEFEQKTEEYKKEVLQYKNQVGEFQNTTNSLQEQFNEAVANITNGAESATNSEIVQARAGEINLNKRLDNMETQTAERAVRGVDVPVNAKDYGVSPNADATETTLKLNECLSKFDRVFLPKGNYNINDVLKIRDNCVLELEGYKPNDLNNKCANLMIKENKKGVELGNGSSLLGGMISCYYVKEHSEALVYINFSEEKRINNKITTSLYGRKGSKGIEISGNGDNGLGFNLDIECFINNCDIGIWGRKEGRCWFNAININSYIQNCVQAVVGNIGNGGSIRGTIQPIINAQEAGTEERALIELESGSWLIDAFIWDKNTAINEWDIEFKQGSLNNIVNSVDARVKNGNKYPFNKITNYPDEFSNKIFPSRGLTLQKSFAGMQDNLLLGADQKFVVKINKDKDLYNSPLKDAFRGNDSFVNIQIPSGKPLDKDYKIEIEIEFDKPRYYHSMGFGFKGGEYPYYYEMHKKINGVYQKVKEGNPNELFAEGKNAFSYNIVIYDNSPAKYIKEVEGVKFVFILNPTKDGKQITSLTTLFYKDGTTENYLPCYGGEVYGDITLKQGKTIILKSPNGNKFKLIVDDEGVLTTRRV